MFVALIAGTAVSFRFAASAREEAEAARSARRDAETNERLAKSKEAEADREAASAKRQALRAEDARHAIQVDLARRALDAADPDRARDLLNEMQPEFHDAWETRHLRGAWTGESQPPPPLPAHPGTVCALVFSADGARIATASDDGSAQI